MEKAINIGIFKPVLLGKARKCDDVINYGMDKDTDISIYNHISNILTLHYILHIYFTSISAYLYLIIYVCISKKLDFLLWLVSPHLQALEWVFFNNTDKSVKIIGSISRFMKSAEISANNWIFQVRMLQKNHYFWFSESLIFVSRIFAFKYLKFQAKSHFTKFSISLTFSLKSR